MMSEQNPTEEIEAAEHKPEDSDEKTQALVTSVIENPEVLSRVLDTPQVQAIVCQHYQGPVPSPDMLREYEQVLPGLAERLVQLTEKEQKHRHGSDHTAYTLAIRGQSMAFAVVVIIILAAVYFGATGNPVLAGILVGIDLAALVTAFIAGKYLADKK